MPPGAAFIRHSMRELSEPAAATIADPASVRAPAEWLVRVRPRRRVAALCRPAGRGWDQNFVELPKMEAELAEFPTFDINAPYPFGKSSCF